MREKSDSYNGGCNTHNTVGLYRWNWGKSVIFIVFIIGIVDEKGEDTMMEMIYLSSYKNKYLC